MRQQGMQQSPSGTTKACMRTLHPGFDICVHHSCVFMPDAKPTVVTSAAVLTSTAPCADCSLALFQHGSLLCALLGGGALQLCQRPDSITIDMQPGFPVT